MIGSIDAWLIIAGVLIGIDILVAWGVYVSRTKSNVNEDLIEDQKKVFLHVAFGQPLPAKVKMDSSRYLSTKRSIHLDKTLEQRLESFIDLKHLEEKYLKLLGSRRETVKAEAIFSLGRIGTQACRLGLEKQLLKEKSFPLKLYIANALSDICNKDSLPVLVYSLINASRFYRTRVNMLICSFGKDLHDLLPQLKENDRPEVQELLFDFSSVYFSEELKNYLMEHIVAYENTLKTQPESEAETCREACGNCMHGQMVADPGKRMCVYKGLVDDSYHCRHYKVSPVSINRKSNYKELIYKACNIVAEFYPKELYDVRYMEAQDLEIRRIAVGALANFRSPEAMNVLLQSIHDQDVRQSAVHAISLIVEKDPEELAAVRKAFLQEKDPDTRKALAEIMSLRIEYYITRLAGIEKEEAGEIVEAIILSGKTSEIIDFFNKNKSLEIEKALVAIIKKVSKDSPELKDAFARYLTGRLSFQCGLPECKEPEAKIKPEKDKKFIFVLGVLLILNLIAIPCVFLLTHWQMLAELSFTAALKLFVQDFNFYFIFYSVAINFIYFLLLLLSFVHVGTQKRLWQMKDMSFLFKEKMLPSISIVAPAFNEAKTIIQNVNSLMNLQYPEYELIVVNDGSTDQTLSLLIKEFALKKVDRMYKQELNTKLVRGIYINRNRPKLIVVDKENGGKADSLNTGINVSSKEYICSIDSDSILEGDALLKLVSKILDEDVETPAMGGNVLPINGCKVERGVVQDIRIPKNNLAKFQTVEYIRAFMAGRLGWSCINNLLIISGAFGLFRKERGVSVGGYLTSSGKYKQDTVGEDMEIVVRISRRMRELGNKYKIRYAFNANCWTEVPEDLNTLKKQRYRWQRGLIEIMYFHRTMLFNPKYGSTGLVAMPYFFIFEVLGPIFEMQGYFVVLLAWLLGVLYLDIALLIFASVILTGTLVSLASLLIVEKGGRMFTGKDISRLLFCAVAENFGMRQYFSLLRVGGYLRMFKSSGGWDKAERKGFSRASENFKGGAK